MEGLGPGLVLLVGGLVSVLLVLFLLRILHPGNQPTNSLSTSLSNSPVSTEQKDAIIIVQGGGRVEYLNEPARRMFGLHKDDQADLERLTRYTRPSNEFLSLLSKESQKRISIGTHLTEATSYRIPGLTPLMMVVLRSLDFTPTLSLGENGPLSASILRGITDFGGSVSSSLDLEVTIKTILENVGRLVSAETLELKVWDEWRANFIIYRMRSFGEPRTTPCGKIIFWELCGFISERIKTASIIANHFRKWRIREWRDRTFVGPILHGHPSCRWRKAVGLP
jgi:hypothetical protein